MLKRLFSVLLVLAITSAALAACGKSDGNKVLTWAMLPSYYNQKDTADVLEVFNSKLKEEVGVTVKFKELVADNWTQWMAAGETIDIAWTGYQFDMLSEIANGSYLELEDYITKDETPNLYKEKQDFSLAYESATIDGHLYAIPNEQPIIKESSIMRIPAELMEYFDVAGFRAAINASPITTEAVYQNIDKFLETVYTNKLYDTDFVGKSIDIESIYAVLAKRGYDFVDEKSMICYEAFDETAELKNFIETDSYKLWCKYAAKWFEKGYVPSNVLVSGGSSGARNPVLFAHTTGNWFNTDEDGKKPVYDEYGDISYYALTINPQDLSQNFNGISAIGSEATYTCVPFTAKYPEEAIKVIELLRSEKGTVGNELFNLLVYGFEKNSDEAKEYGKYHYELKDDEIYSEEYSTMPSAETPYGIPHWVVGNVYLAYRTCDILKGQADYAYKYLSEDLPTTHKTPLFGLKIDVSKTISERSNIASVISEYDNRLFCGVEGSNFESLYKEYISKLETAGMSKVLGEYRSQVDKFLQ